MLHPPHTTVQHNRNQNRIEFTMERFFKSGLVICLCSACLVVISLQQASAELIPAHHSSFGTNALTIDTLHNLAWLDLEHTSGLSYTQVIAQTGSGEQFEGFRVASAAEFLGMLQSAGVPIHNGSVFGEEDERFTRALDLIALIGQTDSQAGFPEVRGFVADPTPNIGVRHFGGLDFFFFDQTPTYMASSFNGGRQETVGYYDVGTYLVLPVPEPSTLVLSLVVSGLVLAVWMR